MTELKQDVPNSEETGHVSQPVEAQVPINGTTEGDEVSNVKKGQGVESQDKVSLQNELPTETVVPEIVTVHANGAGGDDTSTLHNGKEDPVVRPGDSSTSITSSSDIESSTLSAPRQTRQSRRSPSIALSISSTSSGHQTISSVIFIKKALESISKSKDARKISALDTSVSKALSR
jgi:hypothetical protein